MECVLYIKVLEIHASHSINTLFSFHFQFFTAREG